MSDALQSFAAELAAEENPARRAALLKRAEMLALNQVKIEAFEPPIRNLGEYLDTPIPVPPSLVWPTVVVRGEITATLGRAGKGKTTMNLNRVIKWAAGRPLFEEFLNKDGEPYLMPDHPLKTLIIENEGSAGMFHHKMGVLVNLCGDLLTDDDRAAIRENIFIWGDGGFSGLKLDDERQLAQVRAGVEKFRPDILFVEPFRGLWKGEENSATDMAAVIDNMLGIAADYDCGVVLSHHERKAGIGDDGEAMSAGRGSTVLEGAVAVMENFQSVKGGDFRELSWSKARYLQPPIPARLSYDSESGWYTFVPITELEAGIIETLEANGEEPMNIAGIADSLNEKPDKVRRWANALFNAGRLRRLASEVGTGGSTGFRYALPVQDGDEGLGIG